MTCVEILSVWLDDGSRCLRMAWDIGLNCLTVLMLDDVSCCCFETGLEFV